MQTIFFIVVRSLPFPANAMTIKSPSSLSRLILPFFPSSFYVAPTAAFSSYYVAASTCSLSLSPSLSLSSPHSVRDGGPKGVEGKDVCAETRRGVQIYKGCHSQLGLD